MVIIFDSIWPSRKNYRWCLVAIIGSIMLQCYFVLIKVLKVTEISGDFIKSFMRLWCPLNERVTSVQLCVSCERPQRRQHS